MSIFGRAGLCGLMLAALIAANGCSPSDSGQMDDEKEPHYVLGKSRVNAMDYAGAVEAFNEALEVNPRSASAHFQLACLFDTRESDPSAAIYHYQEYLRLNPKADNAEVIRQRIYTCKQQLAADVMPLPSAPAAQKQLEELAEKNRQLQAEVERLNGVIKQWSAYYEQQKQQPASTPNYTQPGSSANLGSPVPDDVSSGNVTPNPNSGPTRITTSTPASKPRTYAITKGDTLASVARKYSVSLTGLQAANPGISPTKLRVGQVINLPAK
jgi:LysM repeat protein